MDISPFWMGGIISWLRRLLQKDYNEEPRTNDHRNQQMIRHVFEIHIHRNGAAGRRILA